jgi:3-oxoacyl-[acyl-carrier-protein] synthase II
MSGKSQIKNISSFDPSPYPTRIAAEINDYDPTLHFTPKERRRSERYTQFAVLAARQALEDALKFGNGSVDQSLAIYEGSSLGPAGWFLEQHSVFLEKGYKRANPLTLAIGFPGAASAVVASSLSGIRSSSATTGGSVASILALSSAFNALRLGEIDRALVIGSEAPIYPAILATFCAVNAMSKRNANPATACRPFDTSRDGFVLGEGAAAIVLETEDSAQKRMARPYAELRSIAVTCDNYHITAPDPSGEQIAHAMQLCLEKAGLRAEMIDCFNAHGTATRLNDEVEARALEKTFGTYTSNLPVVSLKGTIGHLLGACGLVEFVASLLSLANQAIPPTANFSILDDNCPLNVVSGKPLLSNVNNIMSCNYSFGGRNTAVILSGITRA